MDEGECREFTQPAVLVLPVRQPRVGPTQRRSDGEGVRESCTVGHQVVERDRAPQRHRPVERPLRVGQHPEVGQLGHPPRDGIVERERALLDQTHGGGDRDRLRHRRDPEDRVALHRQTGVHVAMPERIDLQDLTGLPHQGDRARQEARVDHLADGGLVAFEIHRASVLVHPVRARSRGLRSACRVTGGAEAPMQVRQPIGVKLRRSPTSFNDPSREAEKEVQVLWVLLPRAPTGNCCPPPT